MELGLTNAKTFDFQRFSLVFSENEVHPMGSDSWLLGAICPIAPTCQPILDIGTGTGIVALMLAQRTEGNTSIHAIDISPEAIAVATHNFRRSPWSSKLEAICTDLKDYQPRLAYGLIVCNPPYHTEQMVSEKEARHRSRHESNLPIYELIQSVKRLLSTDGKFVVIAPPAYARQLEELATLSGLYCNKLTEVFSTEQSLSPTRLIVECSYDPFTFQRDKLLIYRQANHYTDEVKQLLKDFFNTLH